MHIIGGAFKGRKLIAPEGTATRPTNARARQAMFDILVHAPWAGRDFLNQARVLDVFAGTGACGLEALSRGAPTASFIENAPDALTALRANITACKMTAQTQIFTTDALNPPPGTPHDLIFLDPPYGQNFVPRALAALTAKNWLTPDALIIAELGPEDKCEPGSDILAERQHGQAKLLFWRLTETA
jgi:16S rRNA (guanine966-N2)-methyltransferase